MTGSVTSSVVTSLPRVAYDLSDFSDVVVAFSMTSSSILLFQCSAEGVLQRVSADIDERSASGGAMVTVMQSVDHGGIQPLLSGHSDGTIVLWDVAVRGRQCQRHSKLTLTLTLSLTLTLVEGNA